MEERMPRTPREARAQAWGRFGVWWDDGMTTVVWAVNRPHAWSWAQRFWQKPVCKCARLGSQQPVSGDRVAGSI